MQAAEEAPRIAEGTRYIFWAIHRVLPILGEACLWAEEVDRAEAVSVRMREHSQKLDHRLGFCWADAIDAIVCCKRGDPESSRTSTKSSRSAHAASWPTLFGRRDCSTTSGGVLLFPP